jgi:hypothetical protein
MRARDKQSSLLQTFVNYGGKKVFNIRPSCWKLYSLSFTLSCNKLECFCWPCRIKYFVDVIDIIKLACFSQSITSSQTDYFWCKVGAYPSGTLCDEFLALLEKLNTRVEEIGIDKRTSLLHWLINYGRVYFIVPDISFLFAGLGSKL